MLIKPDAPSEDLSPTVSVIIPVYNRFMMLRQAATSVLCQSYRDFELIIVDDGSTDETANIGRDGLEAETANIEPRPPLAFLYLQSGHTGMPGAVRNRGARAARGKYIAFLDSDDLWMPRKLELQTGLMLDNPDLRISHTRERWLRDGKVVSQASQRHKRSGRIFDDALIKCIIGPSTVMIERDLFLGCGGFREDLEIAEDYELWLRITATHAVGYIDAPLTVKRGGHADQLSSKYGQVERFRIEALASLLENGFFRGRDRELAAKELPRKCRIYANGARKRGRAEEASTYEALARAYGGQ